MSYFSDDQAVDIWISKWLGEKKQALIAKYGENNFRFYEVWTEERNFGTRLKAWALFQQRYPDLVASVDPSPHVPTRRVVSAQLSVDGDQLSLF